MPNIASLQAQLQAAIDTGNVEMAKVIVDGMKQLNTLAKPKKKKAVKAKKSKTEKTEKKVPKEAVKEEIYIPPPAQPVVEDNIVDLTHLGTSDDDDDNEGRLPTSPRRKEERNYCVRQPIAGNKTNRFNDDGTLEANDRPVNNPALALMYKPAERVRSTREHRPNQMARVRCHICSKIEVIKFELAPQTADDRYKCNDCIVSQR
jgi:hypothetical protein